MVWRPITDRKAEELIGRLDYDFSKAEKDGAMRSGVVARTVVPERQYFAANL